ncbi:MAG TPA: NAD regulator, partial [Caulobacteraceae bacterium]|nr:NAD regulator [Caulobacteraceae bacterium]
MRDGEASVLTVRPRDLVTDKASTLMGLPFGPFDPDGHRTFELALREFVTRQTRFDLGFVEQLYTFGDKGRDAPLADVGAGAARVISVGYLALAPSALDTDAPDTAWAPWSRFFPWEDWRRGRPALIDEVITPALHVWAGASEARRNRARLLFALEDSPWAEERVLERYELLYEAGLAPEAARD